MIDIKNLTYAPSGKTVLSNLSLVIGPGQKHLILGRSGLGKTCLFRLLLGFDTPDSGSVTICGLPLDKDHIQGIRNAVFYLSQGVDLPDVTGEELIQTSLRLNHRPAASSGTVTAYLELLSFSPDLLHLPSGRLSGGERQRLGLLLCFLLDRPIWFLDEPTAALDPQAKKTLVRHILGSEKTVLVTSHDEVWQTSPHITISEWQ